MGWYIASEWILKLVMIPIVAHRRRLTSSLSWLTIIFFLPWLGSLLYLILAPHRLTRRMRVHRRKLDRIRSGRRLATWEAHARQHPFREQQRALSRLTDRLGGYRPVGGNMVELLDDFTGTLSRLLDDVAAAERHVHLLFYIIDDARAGKLVGEALAEAAARGVRCRVLADAIGSRRFHRHVAPALRELGVEVRKLLPIPMLLRRLRPVDLRNHRKLAVIDGRVAYTGSMNLSDAFVSSGREALPWRDVMLRIEGPAVLQLQDVFREDWIYNGGAELEDGAFPALATTGDVTLQVVASGPDAGVEALHHMLVSALQGARERIVLTTPYLIPDEPTRVALRLAALRGVEVDVVVPHRCDAWLSTVANHAFFQEFLDDGIRIHIHRRGFLHSKTLTVDEELAVVGSANFDRRSFHLNFELNLLVYEQVGAAVALQEGYLAEAEPLDTVRWQARGLRKKILEDVVRLLSPLL